MLDTGGIAAICSNLVEACFGNRGRQKCRWQLPTIPDDRRANFDDSGPSLYDNSACQKTAEASIEFSTAMVTGPWVFLESPERSIPWKIEACSGNRSGQKRCGQLPTIPDDSRASLCDNSASQKTAEASIEFSTAMVAGPGAAVPASHYRGDGCGLRTIRILNFMAPSPETGLAMASGFFAPNREGGDQSGASRSVWPQVDGVPTIRL